MVRYDYARKILKKWFKVKELSEESVLCTSKVLSTITSIFPANLPFSLTCAISGLPHILIPCYSELFLVPIVLSLLHSNFAHS